MLVKYLWPCYDSDYNAYIRGTSETITRILQPYNIRIAHKPTRTKTNRNTDREQYTRSNDETGRNLSTRLTEHKRATRNVACSTLSDRLRWWERRESERYAKRIAGQEKRWIYDRLVLYFGLQYLQLLYVEPFYFCF